MRGGLESHRVDRRGELTGPRNLGGLNDTRGVSVVDGDDADVEIPRLGACRVCDAGGWCGNVPEVDFREASVCLRDAPSDVCVTWVGVVAFRLDASQSGECVLRLSCRFPPAPEVAGFRLAFIISLWHCVIEKFCFEYVRALTVGVVILWTVRFAPQSSFL